MGNVVHLDGKPLNDHTIEGIAAESQARVEQAVGQILSLHKDLLSAYNKLPPLPCENLAFNYRQIRQFFIDISQSRRQLLAAQEILIGAEQNNPMINNAIIHFHDEVYYVARAYAENLAKQGGELYSGFVNQVPPPLEDHIRAKLICTCGEPSL